MASAVAEVERFLKELLHNRENLKNILDIDIKEASKKEIASSLGRYLKSKYPNTKIPRVYQFLNYTQKDSLDDVEDDFELLLRVISPRSRDIIEKIIENNRYRVELFSTIGLSRLENQDYLGYLELKNGVLLIVADGVGGGDNGEIASKLVVESILESFKEKFKESDKESIKEFLKNSILKANEQLVNFAKMSDRSTMATTLTLALILNDTELFIAHVGDSRVYELEKSGKVIQRTPDHSVREVLYRSNKITKEEKENYKKNILAYVVGKNNLKAENIFIEYSILYADSKLLLCSDGFWEKIDIDKNIFDMPFNALKEQIYSKIPTDNVTVIRYFPKQNKKIPKDACLECEDDEIEAVRDIKEEKREINSFHNHFSNRKFKNRVLKHKNRFILITVILTIALIAIFIKYIL
jgi:protein phosphatase